MSDGHLPPLLPYGAPPIPGFEGLELITFSTPDEWLNKINEEIKAIYAAINQAAHKGTDAINHMSRWEAGAIGALGGGVIGGPVGGILGGITGATVGLDAAKSLLNGKLGDAFEKIWGWVGDLIKAIQAAVDALFGNPETLTSLGLGYVDASTQLNDAAGSASTVSSAIAVYWQGMGNDAYQATSTAQQNAMTALAAKFLSASHLMADAAQAIKQVWSDIVNALIALVADLLAEVEQAADLGKILAGEVAIPFGVVSDCINFVNAVTSSIRTMSLTAKSQGVMNWADLNSHVSALPSGKWPAVDPSQAQLYGNDHTWGTKPVRG